MSDIADPVADFIRAACVPREDEGFHAHASGALGRADQILAARPEVASASIHTAAIVGDDVAVRRFLTDDPSAATAKGGPWSWDALTLLCFSRYLRLDRTRSAAFVRAAEALLDAGADPNTGFFEQSHQPKPEWESVLYGAAGIAHDAELTRLLLQRGADPNDGETEYHAPEWFDNRAMEVVVESGKLRPDGLATMLLRKLDWTDYKGVAWLLEHGVDPNRLSYWGQRALDHSLRRDNPLRFQVLLLDHSADPTLPDKDGRTPVQLAAGLGRADALDLFQRRGFAVVLEGDDAFLAAVARADEARVRQLAAADAGLVERLRQQDPGVLARFAGAGNTAGVSILLDLGFDVAVRGGRPGEPGGTALHLAVWRERPDTVKLLVERGAPLEDAGGHGHTPLSLAVLAQVEGSEFTPHESLDIVQTLLAAGARVDAVKRFPSGHPETDALLRRYGAGATAGTGPDDTAAPGAAEESAP